MDSTTEKRQPFLLLDFLSNSIVVIGEKKGSPISTLIEAHHPGIGGLLISLYYYSQLRKENKMCRFVTPLKEDGRGKENRQHQ